MAAYRQMRLQTSYLKFPPLKQDCRMTIPDMMKKLAHENPDKMAFVFRAPDQPRVTLTRKELLDQSTAMAHYFVHLGVKVGDKVAVLIQSGKAWMIVQFGLYMAGAITVNSMSYDANALQEIATSVGCAATITETGSQPTTGIQQDSQQLKISFIKGINKSSSLFDTTQHLNNRNKMILPSISPECPAMMFSTSGSTGVPKLVIHTHKSLVIGALSYGQGLGSAGAGIMVNDRPTMWAGGYPWLFLSKGYTYVYIPTHLDIYQNDRFFVDVILTEFPTTCYMMEYRLNSLYNDPQSLARMPRLGSIIIGGHRVTQTHIQRLLKICDEVRIDYGITECLHCFFGTFTDANIFEDGTAGFCPGGCEAKIVNNDGETVPIGQKGELWLRGEGCAKEYLLIDGSREGIVDAGGWYHTNDVAILKPDGMLVILDRTTEIIKRATVRIFPSFVERKLREALDVQDIAVVGIPDERLHQEVCACIILKSDSTLTYEEIRKTALRIFKPEVAPDGLGFMPGHFLILETFPRNSLSKCNRTNLAKVAEDILRVKVQHNASSPEVC